MGKSEPRVPVHGDPGHWIHVSDSPRQVRVIFAGEKIADSKRVKLLREADTLPVYYFPVGDVDLERLVASDRRTLCPYKGEATYWSVRVGKRVAEHAVWSYADPLPQALGIKGHFAFQWDKMDAWYEEGEEVYVHPRDPFKRVDVLASKRHVEVFLEGEVIADTRRPRLLFETNHPVRYYIPREDIRMERLVPSVTRSRCPYKGAASYWSIRAGDRLFEDMAWSYPDPIPECPKIKGLICFFHERGLDLAVDGEILQRPHTKWARPLLRG